jgi:photosystem II stability/assembly factor-like uncharacterized protein
MIARRVLLALLALALAAPAAQWKIIGPGGGGGQFNPTISPHDPKTVLVNCDMTGAYISHDGGGSWRMFNLRGTVRFFAFDPVDPSTIYAGTVGLYRSTDSGRTWRLVYPDPASVVRIVQPDDHAGERFVTRNGQAPRPAALGISPRNPRLLYAAMSEGRGPSAALHVSSDGGRKWRKLTDLPGGARKIYVDPEGDAWVIGRNSVGVWRDGRFQNGAPAPGVESFDDASAGFAGGKLVVYGVSKGGIHISDNSGATWRASAIEPGETPRLPAVAASLHHPSVAYVSYSYRGKYFGVAKTADTGKTWELVWKESKESGANIHDAWVAGRFGPGWASNPLSVGAGPNHPEICYGTNYGATMRTTDGGKSWHAAYSKRAPGGGWVSTGLDVTTTYGVHFDPFDRNRIFISYTDIGAFVSEDGGKTWDSTTRNGVPQRWVNTTYWMEFDPKVKGRVWAVMSGIHDLPRPKMWRNRSLSTYNGGIVVSDDGARTWRVADESLPPSAATHIVLDPHSPVDARVLYVTAFGRGVFKSVDGGKTWALKNKGIIGEEPMAWRLERASDGTLYLVVARRTEDGSMGDAGDGALYRSRDGAETWERVRLPEGVNGPNGLAADPADPRRLYLAAWGRNTPEGAMDGGIFLSTDAGASWRHVLAKDQHIYDVTVDPRSGTLYACGFESSAWRSEDRGATWKRIRGYNFKWGHRVVPDPYDPKSIYVTTFGGSVWHGPAHGDPSAVEDIVTPEAAHHRK